MGSNHHNPNRSDVFSMGFENEAENDISDSWKYTLNFTGSNPVFPVEMYIALMESKYAIQTNEYSKIDDLSTDYLNHICDDETTPAGLWKKQYLSHKQLENMDWLEVKKSLMKHFGQQHTLPGNRYSMQERLLLFYSMMRHPDEELKYFLVRVNIVASILENGNPGKKANQDWVRLFFLLGLNDDDRSLIIEEADFIYDLNGLSLLLLERRQNISVCDSVEGEQKPIIDPHIYPGYNSNSFTNDTADKDGSSGIPLLNGDSNTSQTTDQVDLEENVFSVPNLKEEMPQSNTLQEWKDDSKFSIVDTLPPKKRSKKRKKGLRNKQNSIEFSSQNTKGDKTGGARSACVICNKTFDTVGEFKKHNLDEHPADKPIKCPYCDFERPDRRNVQIHIQRSHGNQSNPDEKCVCPQCKKTFTFRFNLNKHIRLSHGDGEKYKCHLCPHRCDYKTRLQEHINAIHTGVKNFKCEKCSFATSWRSQLIRHLWQVHNEGKGSVFTCEQCGYTTKRKELYRNHLMNVHNIGDFRPALCTLCGMTFKTKNYLMDHMYKVHKKTLRGKDTKAAMKEKADRIGKSIGTVEPHDD